MMLALQSNGRKLIDRQFVPILKKLRNLKAGRIFLSFNQEILSQFNCCFISPF